MNTPKKRDTRSRNERCQIQNDTTKVEKQINAMHQGRKEDFTLAELAKNPDGMTAGSPGWQQRMNKAMKAREKLMEGPFTGENAVAWEKKRRRGGWACIDSESER